MSVLAKKLYSQLAYEPLVICNIVWCMYHQAHLIDKAVLAVLEGSGWRKQWPANYFTAVSNISTTARSLGMKRKMQAAVKQNFSDSELSEAFVKARAVFSKSVGRCLRGRWGAIDSVEDWILEAWPYLEKVMFSALHSYDDSRKPRAGQRTRRRRKPEAAQPGQDEDDDWKAHAKAARQNTLALATDELFCMAVRISRGIKAPLRHFMNWSDQQPKLTNLKIKEAINNGLDATYLGPTPCSRLVEGQAELIKDEVAARLSCAALADEALWAPLWRQANTADDRAQAKQLIVELTLLTAASWEFRVLDSFRGFPMAFMLLVAVPAHTADDRRRGVAARLLDTPECCLKARPALYLRSCLSDMAWKLKAWLLMLPSPPNKWQLELGAVTVHMCLWV